ncbi:helix-turn-helix domain-containing protein [Streptomyces sp. NPDC093064]|uniref:helix-turn-helix domain-containing protein n=1 Tax=unclassified Streptomyces TaxID=2593676 RepID=UPI003690B1FB
MLSEDKGRRRGNPPAEVEALRAELMRIKEEKQLSLNALARDSEISRSTWNRVLKGESFPPRKEIERLSRRPGLEAQHLVGLWEAADAALKRAAAADVASPAAADGDDTATPPTATAADPAGPDNSIASAAAAAPNPSKGDTLDDAATGPAPAEPMPSASPSARPDATTAAKTTPLFRAAQQPVRRTLPQSRRPVFPRRMPQTPQGPADSPRQTVSGSPLSPPVRRPGRRSASSARSSHRHPPPRTGGPPSC